MKIFNTKSRAIEKVVSIEPNLIKMYACGPTVYNFAHIGNLRTYIFEDVLKRVLLYNGYKVKHIINITDVGHLTSDGDTGDDKMENGAQREGKSVWDIAKFYEEAFKNDFAELNCIAPEIWCRATEHIAEQIELVKKLEEKGFTYKIADGIYFDSSKFTKYADFAKLNIDNNKAGIRVEMTAGKKNSSDFALWKFSPTNKKRAMEWDSPWGVGFPGWHIECSAMASKYLGETFDIHCGGIDHIPVHHTNEIAQSEAASGKPFVNYWVHGEFLITDKEKMAKSGSNFLTLKVLKDNGFDPLDYRYLCFTAHYRMQFAFTWESLQGAKKTLSGIRDRVASWQENNNGVINSEKVSTEVSNFKNCVSDDLNMPQAIAVMWDVIKNNEFTNADKLEFIKQIEPVLGLNLLDKKEVLLPEEIEKMIEERNMARKNKNFAKSDEIRNNLLEKGIILEDTPAGVRWKKK